MATRSFIAINNEEQGTFTAVYCQYDGDTVGQILNTHYRAPKKAEDLISLGNLSYVAAKLSPVGESHSFSTPEDGVTVAYHRDRGEQYYAPMEFSSIDSLVADAKNTGCLYLHIYTAGAWDTYRLPE